MKIGFLITARLKSSRLPLKILKDLNGKPVIEHIINRAREVRDISDIILCTSVNPQDKTLVDIAKNNQIYYFNGSEDDVLQRLRDAAHFFSLDFFLSITADNPLFSIDHANQIADILKRENHDFVKLSGLPLGTALYGVKTTAVHSICRIKNIIDTEIWGYMLDQPEFFSVKELPVQGVYNRPEFRLTLDYEEDYRLLHHLYTHISYDNVLSLYEVIHYLNRHPHIATINQSCRQRDIDLEVKAKIQELFRCYRDELSGIKDYESLLERWQ